LVGGKNFNYCYLALLVEIVPLVRIIEFDYDLHHSDLHRLNIEYVTWVGEQQRLASDADLEQILGMSIGEYVESFLEEFMKIKPPKGVILLLEDEGSIVGMGALQEFASGIGEIKRMYIRSNYQNRGFGRAILDILISKGRDFGFRKLRLDTADYFPYALHLYRSAGFVEVDRFANSEVPEELRSTFMELGL
jgi:ribosomal protein S18 acetylase RimI-like enzyme